MTEHAKEKKTEKTESTFVVHIKYHQNRTWQGELIREGKDEKILFRSELELLRLIQDSLDVEQPDD